VAGPELVETNAINELHGRLLNDSDAHSARTGPVVCGLRNVDTTNDLEREFAGGAASGLPTLNKDQIAERGARMARRDD
jgi:hypothetical protein